MYMVQKQVVGSDLSVEKKKKKKKSWKKRGQKNRVISASIFNNHQIK